MYRIIKTTIAPNGLPSIETLKAPADELTMLLEVSALILSNTKANVVYGSACVWPQQITPPAGAEYARRQWLLAKYSDVA